AAGEPLLDFAETDVVTLEVRRDGETLAFEKDDAGNWQMTRPDQDPVEPGAIAFLLDQLSTATSQPPVTITPDQQADFGFDAPVGQVDLELADGTTHTVVLGGSAFSGSDLYVLVDPAEVPLPEDARETTVYVMPQNLANGVNRPLEEWKIAQDPAPEPTEESLDPEAAEPEAAAPDEEAEPRDSTDTDTAPETPEDADGEAAEPEATESAQ
ncbi:hypothetical protein C7271_11080, partial [filamentous cyanobacterium CCP5]